MLIERGDFGGETSWNSLRILHGGLRYLQTMDLSRFRESVRERRWWIQTYPELVQPLACVMPLYGRGLKRPAVLRLALAANDLLTANRNQGVRQDRRLGRGRILSPAETREMFPTVELSDLVGAALWFDATMPSSERLLIEMLHWANASGAVCLNYVRALRVLTHDDQVVGLAGEDARTASALELRARGGGQLCRAVEPPTGEQIRPRSARALHTLFGLQSPAGSSQSRRCGARSSRRTGRGQNLFSLPLAWQGSGRYLSSSLDRESGRH